MSVLLVVCVPVFVVLVVVFVDRCCPLVLSVVVMAIRWCCLVLFVCLLFVVWCCVVVVDFVVVDDCSWLL